MLASLVTPSLAKRYPSLIFPSSSPTHLFHFQSYYSFSNFSDLLMGVMCLNFMKFSMEQASRAPDNYFNFRYYRRPTILLYFMFLFCCTITTNFLELSHISIKLIAELLIYNQSRISRHGFFLKHLKDPFCSSGLPFVFCLWLSTECLRAQQQRW